VIFLYSFIISSQLGAGHRWIFFRLLSFDCDDQWRLHIFLRSSTIWYFVYSLALFTIYGYITNSQCDQFPVSLIAQLVEHFQALISQLLKLSDCDDQSCLHIFLRSSDKWYFVYSLAWKVNCHKTSQYGNNRTNVWIETQKQKTLKKINTWWFPTISVFETSLYLLTRCEFGIRYFALE